VSDLHAPIADGLQGGQEDIARVSPRLGPNVFSYRAVCRIEVMPA